MLTASVRICGKCFVALTVAERCVILTTLLYRNGMVGEDGTVAQVQPAMFTVLVMPDQLMAPDGSVVKKTSVFPTITARMRKLGLLSGNKLVVAPELLALKYLAAPGVTEIDLTALGLPEHLKEELFHEKDKLHPKGPIFAGRRVVPLGCEHVTVGANVEFETSTEVAPMQQTLVEDSGQIEAIEAVDAAESAPEVPAVPEEAPLGEQLVAATEASHESAELESYAPSDEGAANPEPEVKQLDVEAFASELREQDGLTDDLVDAESVGQLAALTDQLQKRVAELEAQLEFEKDDHQTLLKREQEAHENTRKANKVLLEHIELLRARLRGQQLPEALRERIMRLLSRQERAAETPSS